jgi:phage terminase large subunit
MHNNEIAVFLKSKIVVADSAEPKSISEIARHNINIVGAKKGADSIMYGVQLLQSNNILMTSRSTELIREQRNYCFDKDKNGVSLNKPIDAYNHCMDASRYIATQHLGKKDTGHYYIRR